MEIMLYILVFVLLLSVLVLVHEAGHFLVARLLGVKVLRFSVGFGKPLWRHKGKKSGIEYLFAPILCGGYVQLDSDSYAAKPIWRRMLIMVAGVGANILFALLLFWAIFVVGIQTPKPIIGAIVPNSIAAQAGLQPQDEIKTIDGHKVYDWQGVAIAVITRLGDRDSLTINGHQLQLQDWKVTKANPDPLLGLGIKPYRVYVPPVIAKVISNTPAQRMGLQPQDKIVSLNNVTVSDWYSAIDFIRAHPDQKVVVTVERSGNIMKLTGKIGHKMGADLSRIGYFGVFGMKMQWARDKIYDRHYGVVLSAYHACCQIWDLLRLNFVVCYKMVTGKISLSTLGGPLTIFSATEMAFQQGIAAYIGLLAMLSVMFAFINFLPIPVLDGGNFLFLLYESIVRKPIPLSVQTIAMRIGLLFLSFIIFIAVYNDVMRIFS